MEKAELGDYHTSEGLRELLQLGLIDTKQNDKGETIYVPTGIGLLLFGKKPELVYNNAVIRATYKTESKKEDIEMARWLNSLIKYTNGIKIDLGDRLTGRNLAGSIYMIILLKSSTS